MPIQADLGCLTEPQCYAGCQAGMPRVEVLDSDFETEQAARLPV